MLVSGGVFVVDFINGWSFLKEPEKDKYFYESKGVKISQFEQVTLNKKQRLVHIDYRYLIERKNENIKTIYAEEDLRIFFDDEVELLMNMSRFEKVRSYADYSVGDKESANTPNVVIVVGQKR